MTDALKLGFWPLRHAVQGVRSCARRPQVRCVDRQALGPRGVGPGLVPAPPSERFTGKSGSSLT